jgi:nucleoside-diphosphate-sugar epimerase
MSAQPRSAERILVTGAGGFIGSHLVDLLLGRGRPVRALLRYTSEPQMGHLADTVLYLRGRHGERSVPDLGPNAVAYGPLEIVWGDIADAGMVRDACRGIGAICHLAALIGIPYSYVAPASYVAVNVLGTLNLLEAARSLGVRRLIQTSTSEVYGTAEYTPIDLAHPLRAQSIYAATKIGSDKLAESYARSFGMDVVILRPFNTFGPRQSFRAVIPTIIGQALAGGPVRLGSLGPLRDFTYVLDTCRAYDLALDADLEPGTTLHLGTGKAVSVAEIVEQVGKLLGRRLEVETEEGRVRPGGSEVMTLLSDPSGARASLGWTPEVGLSEGLGRTLDWFREAGRHGGDRYHV